MTYPEVVGHWMGVNGFRMMPADPLAELPAAATVTTAAGGHLLSVAYSWQHPDDGPQDGLVVVSPAGEGDELTAVWADSWHQQPTVMTLSGTRRPDGFAVTGAYAGDWGWTVRLIVTGDGELRLQMDNVVPATDATPELPAGPYPVMVTSLHRR